jgi:Tol biopolymer transport system component
MRVLLALSVLALASLWIIDRRGVEALPRTVYMEVHPPSGTTFAAISNGQFDISPDGSKLLFVAGPKGGRQQLWIQRLDKRQAESLAGTEEARFPFWSPDSRRLAFWAAGKLWRVEPGKGAAEPICDSSLPVSGGTWNRDDVSVQRERQASAMRNCRGRYTRGGFAARSGSQ